MLKLMTSAAKAIIDPVATIDKASWMRMPKTAKEMGHMCKILYKMRIRLCHDGVQGFAFPKHPMQNLLHAMETEFLAEGAASVCKDRCRGGGSTQVRFAAILNPCAWLTNASLVPSPYRRPFPECQCSMSLVFTAHPFKRRPSYGPGLRISA